MIRKELNMLDNIPNVKVKTKDGRLEYFEIQGNPSNTIRSYEIKQGYDGIAEVTITFLAQVNEEE